MKTYIIYIVRHTVSGRAYIGSTSETLKLRCDNHRRMAKSKGSTSKLHEAIREYGWGEFSVKTLATVHDISEADELERRYVKKYKTIFPSGYNLTNGGKSNFIFHPDSLKKLSVASSGENNPFFGKTHSEESKRKLSKKLLGKPGPNLGRKFSEESKEKMSKSHLGNTNRLGKTFSEEAKEKISNSLKKYYATMKEAKKLIEEVK